MTATTHTASVKDSSVFSTEKKKGGSYVLTSAAVTALGSVSTSTKVSEVLDILSEVVKASHVVAPNQIGKATSEEN